MDKKIELLKKKKKKAKGITAKAKKKTATARASIRKGTGRITLNKMNVKTFQPWFLRELIMEPVQLAGPLAQEIDVDVFAVGGGSMGQAGSARTAIAKAIIEYTGDEKLKKKYLQYDRMLLVDDPRRKEAKKPLGRGARKKKQLSFR